MADACAEVIAEWQARQDSGVPIEVAQEISSLTLTVVGRALFGMDLSREGSKVAPALAEVQRHIVDRISLTFVPRALALVERVPSPRNRRYRAAVATLDELVWEIIKARRSSSQPDPDDLLGCLMSARDEDGRSLSDEELRDEVMTFVLAGHETTANALTWTLYLLSRHPSVGDELCAEAAEVLGPQPHAGGPRQA